MFPSALVPDERAELTRLSMVPRSGSQQANQAWMPEVVTAVAAPISVGGVEGHNILFQLVGNKTGPQLTFYCLRVRYIVLH